MKTPDHCQTIHDCVENFLDTSPDVVTLKIEGVQDISIGNTRMLMRRVMIDGNWYGVTVSRLSA